MKRSTRIWRQPPLKPPLLKQSLKKRTRFKRTQIKDYCSTKARFSSDISHTHQCRAHSRPLQRWLVLNRLEPSLRVVLEQPRLASPAATSRPSRVPPSIGALATSSCRFVNEQTSFGGAFPIDSDRFHGSGEKGGGAARRSLRFRCPRLCAGLFAS